MLRETLSRRSVLTIAGSCALASAGVAYASEGPEVSHDTFELLAGTERETTVYVTDSAAAGPTVAVIGGVHGNEVAGYVAANEIVDWTPEAGTLVTIPEANVVAIEDGTRTDDQGVDLNRQFPEGTEPTTDLARAIWDVLLEYDPDVVIDLHESIGIYAGDPVDGVGQAIFHSGGETASTAADEAIAYVNDQYVDESKLAFQTGGFSGPGTEPSGLLVHKAARDLDAASFLIETLSVGLDLETRVEWQLALVEALVADGLFPNGGGNDEETDVDDPPEEPDDDPDPDPDEPDDGSGPTADIRTVPADAAERTLEAGETVELDASCSTAHEGELTCYEWYLTDDDDPDATGEIVDVTVAADVEHGITLRVVDEADRTDTAEITLAAE